MTNLSDISYGDENFTQVTSLKLGLQCSMNILYVKSLGIFLDGPLSIKIDSS